MFGALKSGGETSSRYDRRVYHREQIPFARNLFYIDLGHSKAGTVLNISEGGLAVQAIADSIDDRLPKIRFKFSQSEIWVETGGRVVWANESRDVAGVEFISLSDEGRHQIREWLIEIHTPRLAVTAEAALQPLPSTNPADPLVSPGSQLTGHGEFHPTELGAFAQPVGASARKDVGLGRDQDLSHRRLRLLIGLFVFLSMILLVLLSLARRVHNTRIDRQEPQDKTVAETTESPISMSASSEHPAPATALSQPVDPSKQVPGFVLQTAAMAHEENANALANSLRQRNFPAFVSKSDSDGFYRVYVGPYRDHYSAVNIDNQLVRQGFTAILRRWSPTQ
jgi:hypothetical protein